MGQERLEILTMMAAHYSFAQLLDTQAIVKSYIQANQEVVPSVHHV